MALVCVLHKGERHVIIRNCVKQLFLLRSINRLC
nr:MAG TPA: hypothetical protein [Bacteriophage sp.]